MKIFLVRHGESTSNVDPAVHKEFADHAIPLSSKGVVQAMNAGQVIHDYLMCDWLGGRNPRPEDRDVMCRLWCSPYERTRQTADGIMRSCGSFIADRKEHVLLCEQQFGLFDGLSSEERTTLYPNEHAFYLKCKKFGGKFWARMPQGESRFDVATRVHQAFGTFHRDHDKHGIKNIIVVCHGVTLRAFVMMWCHLSPEWFDAEPNPNNGSVRLIHDGIDIGYLNSGS